MTYRIDGGRTAQIEVKVTPHEKASWAQLAKAAGVTLAEWLRTAAYEKAARAEERHVPDVAVKVEADPVPARPAPEAAASVQAPETPPWYPAPAPVPDEPADEDCSTVVRRATKPAYGGATLGPDVGKRPQIF